MLSTRNKLQHLLSAILMLLFALTTLGTSVAHAAGTTIACSPTGAETVVTDKSDYAPEETVHITGAGYAASCQATVRVTRPDGSIVKGDGSFESGSDSVTTSTTGDLAYNYILDGIAGTYIVDVVGAASQVLATTTFTDGTLRIWGAGVAVNGSCGLCRADLYYTLIQTTNNCSGGGFSTSGVMSGIQNTTISRTATQSVILYASYISRNGVPFSGWTGEGPFTNLGSIPFNNVAGYAICVPGFAGTGIRNYYAHYEGAPPPPPPPADTTPPTVTANTSPLANANGWNNSDVTVTANGTDSGSGIASCTTVVVSSEGAGQSATVSCTDNAGNSSSTTVGGINIDKTAPTVACGAADGIWHANEASIACTASDATSGLANVADANFNLTTSVASGTENPNASTNSRSIADLAGNSATAGPVSGNKIDKKVPSISITSPGNTSYLLGQVVAANYGCSDGGSGIALCVGTVANSASINTSSVGAKTFTVNATDNVANTNNASVSYNVIYNFSNFFPPVDNLPTLNQTKAGGAIPVKFSLAGNQGLGIFAPGFPVSQQVACDGSALLDDIEETATAGNSSLTYDPGSNQYHYVWKTDSSWAGTCRQLNVKLIDGTDHKANFKFK